MNSLTTPTAEEIGKAWAQLDQCGDERCWQMVEMAKPFMTQEGEFSFWLRVQLAQHAPGMPRRKRAALIDAVLTLARCERARGSSH